MAGGLGGPPRRPTSTSRSTVWWCIRTTGNGRPTITIAGASIPAAGIGTAIAGEHAEGWRVRCEPTLSFAHHAGGWHRHDREVVTLTERQYLLAPNCPAASAGVGQSRGRRSSLNATARSPPTPPLPRCRCINEPVAPPAAAPTSPPPQPVPRGSRHSRRRRPRPPAFLRAAPSPSRDRRGPPSPRPPRAGTRPPDRP